MSALVLVLNLKNLAVSQYAEFDFNSMCKFNGVYLGANETGIYQLETGDDDEGVPIDVYFEVETSLGIPTNKHVRRVDISGECDGDLLLTTSFDDGAQYQDTVTFDAAGTYKTIRKTMRRTCRGKYLRFRLDNVDGSNFNIDNIVLHVIPIATRNE